jgi:PAS domain S-box-containing protein
MKKEKRRSAAVLGPKLPANKQSPGNRVETFPPGRMKDTQRLLHELEVHRTKLEKKNAELLKTREELETTLARYAELYDLSPVAYFTLSRNGAILEVNLTGATLLGIGRSRLIGRDFQLFVPDKERPALIAFLDRVFASKTKESYETALTKEGQPAYFVMIEAVAGPSSRDCRVAIINISDRDRTERIMHARLRLLQFANSHSLDELLQAALDEVGILTGSPIGFYHFVEADQKTLSLQAWSTGTLSGICTIEGKGRHYDVSEAGVWVDSVRERRPVIHNDYSALPHRKGMPRGHAAVVRELVVPVLRGDRIMAILGVGNKPYDYNEQDMETVTQLADMAWDMVEHKLAEKEIIAAKDNFERFFNLIPELACIVSTDGFFRKLNPAWERTLGYKIEKLQNAPLFEFIHPEDIEPTVKECERKKDGELTIIFKNRYRHEDGSYRWLEWVALPVKDAGVIYAAARDITEMIRLEQEAKLSQARLIQANKMSSLGLIASGIAHEINNPNNYILSNATLLAQAWSSAMPILEEYYRENGDFSLGDIQYSAIRDNAPRLFSGLVEGAKRIRGIVERIKDFTRQDTGITNEAFDVGKMILDAMAILDHEIKKCCENFRIEAASGLPPALGNAQQIGQVMINLLVNALQALPDKKRGIRIATGLADDGEQIFIKMEDEGIGIPPKALERVFEPFFTTKRAMGGTGLGLSISASILRENQGTLSFASEPGRGTTATVLLRTLKKKEQ